MKYTFTVILLMHMSTLVFSQKPIEDINGDLIKNKKTITSNSSQKKARSGNSLPIINVIPSPISFPHDITFDGDNLWIAGYNDYQLFQISMMNGSILKSIPTNMQRPYGLTFDGQYLWVADADNDIIQKVDTANGNVITTINSPASLPSYSAGLAFDGINIWQNDQRENLIATPGDSTFVINQTGTLVNGYEAKGNMPGGLTFDGTYIWSTDNDLDEIHKIDPSTFSIVETYDSPGNISLGLAFDGQYLWVADNGSDSLYQLDIGLALSNSTFEIKYEPINIYPNPSNQLINIDLKEKFQSINVSVIDLNGRIVQNVDLENREFLEIDLNPTHKGIFFVKIKADQEISTHKVIVK